MSHDLYQNRVFITDRFNLLNPESKDKKRIPYLKILVDSGSFELPFGRHDLQNEKILSPLSEYIRRVILPDYFEKVADKTWINGEIIRDFELAQFEKMSLAIMQLWPDLKKPWCHIPVFNVYNQEKKSLYDLEKLVVKTGKIYLAPKDDSGLDFSLFDGPVLLSDQVENGVDFLQKIFAKNITDLSDAGDIIEAPSHHCPEITGKEKNLEKHLGFHHELFESLNMKHGKIGVYKKATNEQTNFSDAKEVGLHLDNLTWRVNYLLNLNLTPCLIKRFIIKGTTLILNLYHPDVKKLVQISTIDCKLAGHWAVAMCLTEEHSAFPQFSAEAKEDLLILDAIIKISTSNNFLELMLSKEFLKVKKTCMNILKNFEKKYNMN
jgi:hypothetical protein